MPTSMVHTLELCLLSFIDRCLSIEAGYIHCSATLYRVKKGKQVQYVKDDRALEDYLLELALDGINFHVNPQSPAISKTALSSLVSGQGMLAL